MEHETALVVVAVIAAIGSIITATISTVGVIIAAHTREIAKQTNVQVNGRMTELLDVTRELARSEGASEAVDKANEVIARHEAEARGGE